MPPVEFQKRRVSCCVLALSTKMALEWPALPMYGRSFSCVQVQMQQRVVRGGLGWLPRRLTSLAADGCQRRSWLP